MRAVEKFVFRGSLIALALGLSACGGGGGGGGASTGVLHLGLTDAPVADASHVWVQFSGIELQSSTNGRQQITFESPKQIDLLALAGGGSAALLEGQTLPAGDYQWIRLDIDTNSQLDSYIETATGSHELTIPSGAQTGLKLVRNFVVPAGGSADFTIDFDLRKSIVQDAAGNYLLKPTLRMVNNVQVGSVAGSVDVSSLCGTVQGPAVYVYTGFDATPVDLNSTTPGVGPLTVAPVQLVNSGYQYKAAFLEAGDYTVALACNASIDRADQVDVLNFVTKYNVTVNANTVTDQPFLP